MALAFIFCFLFLLFVDEVILLPVMVGVLFVTPPKGDRRSLFSVVLRVILFITLNVTIAKDPIMVYFHFNCIVITYIIKQLSPRVAAGIFHIFTLVFIIDACVFEIETLHYASSLVFFVSYRLRYIASISILTIILIYGI